MSAYEGMSFADLLLARQGDQRTALLFEDERHSWDDVVRASAVRAALARDRLDPARSPHVGVLLENTPEYLYWLGGAALERVTAVGINPTRRGAELARDVRHTDCQLIVTNREHLPLLDLDGIGLRRDQVLVVDDEPYLATLAEQSDTALPVTAVQPDDRLLLLFTSGSTGGPKAVICSQGRIVRIVDNIQRLNDLSSTTVAYLSMPMFHGNALMVNVTPMVALGGTIAMRRRFSASGFLPDVRRFGATFFNYVGRALAYVLATPEHPDDADNTLQVGFGTEASQADRERFERRFGCRLVESYGCSEGDVHINPTPGMPAGALGRALPGTEVAIVNPDTGRECEPARFDAGGALANGEAALGELVARGAAGRFEGYYNNPEATSRRIRGGDVWTGDFGYRDADGFIYFAGRSADLLRVDSENFAAAPVERILLRQPGV
jgi:fatty-acyl-CoA synthase